MFSILFFEVYFFWRVFLKLYWVSHFSLLSLLLDGEQGETLPEFERLEDPAFEWREFQLSWVLKAEVILRGRKGLMAA
jgi:hypothetical protein